jgi:choline dehydrogenase
MIMYGQRCSNGVAYLGPAEGRPNLTVITDAHVTQILVHERRATGVAYVRAGRKLQVQARREVIVSAGAVGSPHLLLLSGIGPAAQLKQFDIPVVCDLPGVGENLQDHLDAFVCMRERGRLSMSFHPLTLWRTLKSLWRYIFHRDGELTSNVAEAGGFIKADAQAPIPDVQLHFVPLVNAHHGQDLTPVFRWHGYTIMTYELRPKSRGTVSLASRDPFAPPRIDPRHFSDPRDLQTMVTALKMARGIAAQPALAPHNLLELEPGPAIASDDDIRTWLRQHAETLYHPVGTCRMGRDPMAVVDPRLRVHGFPNLRVIDASIMPTLIGGNTNAPTTMIAEKGARMLLEDAESLTAACAEIEEAVPA